MNFLFPFKILTVGLEKVLYSQFSCFKMLISQSKRKLHLIIAVYGRYNFIKSKVSNNRDGSTQPHCAPGKMVPLAFRTPATKGLKGAAQSSVESTDLGNLAYIRLYCQLFGEMHLLRSTTTSSKEPNSAEICFLIAKRKYRRSKQT